MASLCVSSFASWLRFISLDRRNIKQISQARRARCDEGWRKSEHTHSSPCGFRTSGCPSGTSSGSWSTKTSPKVWNTRTNMRTKFQSVCVAPQRITSRSSQRQIQGTEGILLKSGIWSLLRCHLEPGNPRSDFQQGPWLKYLIYALAFRIVHIFFVVLWLENPRQMSLGWRQSATPADSCSDGQWMVKQNAFWMIKASEFFMGVLI